MLNIVPHQPYENCGGILVKNVIEKLACHQHEYHFFCSQKWILHLLL